MRLRGDRARRDRRAVEVTDFCGLDLTSSPARVPIAFACDGENFTVRAGVLCKRRGWGQIYPRLPSRVNGMFTVDGEAGETLLCYAGTEFYLLVDGEWMHLPVKNLAGGTSAGDGDRRIFGFSQGGKLYLIGTGLYLCYGCFDGEWEIRTVDPYVPTTTVGIAPVAEGDTARESGESVNLLTPRRKNTLFGGEAGSTWYLDAPVSPSGTVEILATVVREGNLVERRFSNRPDEGGERIYDAEGLAAGSIELATGKLSLGENTDAGGSYPSISVTFSAASGFFGETDTAGRQAIREARMACLFGVGGACDRLFLAGGERYPNVLFFSEAGDFSYFPDVNTVRVGTDAEEIRACLPLGDGTLAVFHTARDTRGATVHYLFGQWREVTGEDGSLLRSFPVFSVRAGAVGECPVNAHAVAELAGERLLLSPHGVYSVELMKDLATDVRRLAERSYGIRASLCGQELAAALLFSHAGRLYLSTGDVEGTVYVTEPSTLARDAGAGSASYAWWRFSGIRACVAGTLGDRLLLGTLDGRILCEREDFADRTWEVTRAGELGFDFPHGKFVYGETLDARIRNGQRLRFESEGILARFLSGTSRIEGTRVYADATRSLPLYSFGALYPARVGSGPLREGTPCYLVDPDPVTHSFSLAASEGGEAMDLTGTDPALELYLPISGRELCVRDVDGEARSFLLSLEPSSAPLPPVNYFLPAADGTSILPLDPIATVTDEREVCAHWELPPMDFGEATAQKTLLSLSFSGVGEIDARVGTLHASSEAGTLLGNDGDGKTSLVRLTLSSEESESAYRRLHLRRMGRLHIRLSSPRGACEIHGVRALARIEHEIKGVSG